jgi:hypothetical protein
MSQHDLNIANQGFPAFRADLNDALVALGSTNSGATAPTTPYANQLWYDTANNILKIRNEDNDAWISIATLDQSGDLVASFTATNITAATALIADTINEKTSAAGVTIDGVLLKDGEINAVGVVKALGTSAGGGELRAYEDTDNGTNFVSLKAPATLAADRTFVLPSADGTSGQALTTDGSGNLAFSSVSVSTTLLKNRIINGAMVIDQRNAGASISAVDNAFAVDRWRIEDAAGSGSKGNIQQNQGSVTPPAGFTSYVGFTTTSAYSVGANDTYAFQQRLEGFNTADLDFGKSTAKTVTLSFWVRSSLTGTFGGSLRNNAANRSYPFSYTILVADTWEYKTITIAGDTTGTWVGATNGLGIMLSISLGAGTNRSGTAGAWNANNNYSATGATSVVGTDGATFYITGVQLEVGTQATGYEYENYGVTLQKCQRYCYVLTNTDSEGATIGVTSVYSTTALFSYVYFPVPMRTIPSLSTVASGGNWFNNYFGSSGQSVNTAPAISSSNVTTNTTNVRMFFNTFTGLTVGQAGWAQVIANAKAIFSAEL